MDFATRALHSGFDSSAWGGSSVMPIVASAAFSPGTPEALEDIFAGRAPGHVYGRLTNPTVNALERRWAALEEGARGCAAFSTGMAAVSAIFTALTESGDEVVSSTSLFGGTQSYFNNILSRTGVTVVSVDPDDVDAVRRAVTPKTRLLFLEALGNPRMDVPDVEAWSQIAADANIPLILDTTLVTPALFRAKDYGVAVTVQSGTKFLTGNGTVLSGAVTDTGVYRWKDFPGTAVKTMAGKTGSDMAFLVYLRRVARQNMGGSLSPFDAYLAMLGADTLDLRMDRHSSNALALAEYLEGRDDVPSVSQVGLVSSPWHERASRYFGERWGGLLTFRTGSRERAFGVLSRLKIARVQTNLGDARTLALHLESTIHREQSPEELAGAGVSDDLIRISVGLESIGDLIDDFEQALNGAGS
ncbi:MAG: aminotransferase class I/II-fold pyridoxal phosphate-dependent enzyme [Spirochaetaceae bacterium]|nr:aminotransferase class I/II-fold pyridoxal phosphate-dependent enzyme [Spirochaetaceae bacterium]MDT8296735.1 aminotransferase class I/II-fold pyridoxal phosphate-dependent enzyme [Spirochaetaceae bacterium]